MHREDPGRPFYTLLRWGHGFDRWVNLFGSPSAPDVAPDPSPPPSEPVSARSSSTVDAYVARVEQILGEQVRRGGLTAKAKDAIDKALDSLHERPPTDRS